MDLALTPAQQEIREAIFKICARFGDDYWLAKDRDGGFPHEFHKALAEAGWLGIAMPEAYGGAGLGITEAAIMMQAVAESGAAFSGRLGAAHEHLRAQPRGGVRHRGAEAPLPAAADRGQGEGLLCRHRAGRRARHHQAQDPRRARRQRLRRARPEDLDLDGAGGRQDAAAGAHDAARRGEKADRRFVVVLHRARPQVRGGARDRQDGPQGGRLQPAVLRRPAGAAGGPHRRGRPGLRVHPARHEPRAHPDRRGGDRHRAGGARAPRAIRQGAHRVRPADRQEPGDPASARQGVDGARGGQPDGAEGGEALRRGRAVRHRGQRAPSISAARPASRPARRRC